MTSLNNIQNIIEPALTAVLAGMMGALVFSFCQYFSERRQRRELRNSWSASASKGQVGPAANAAPPAPAFWNWLAASMPAKATRAAAEPFPSFASYFRHHITRYGYAILSVTLVLIVRWLLEPVLEGSMPFSFFLAAVLFTARTQGVWETILALVLGFLLGTWFFAHPKSLGFSGQHDWWAAILYLTVGLGILWFLKSEQTAWLRTLTSDIAALKTDPPSPLHQFQTTRNLLASIVDCAQDPILSLTPEGRIMTWNAAAEKRFGWSAQEAIGQPLANLLPPTLHAELGQIIAGAGRGERLKPWQITLKVKNGDPIEASANVSPIQESPGQLRGVSLIVQTVT